MTFNSLTTYSDLSIFLPMDNFTARGIKEPPDFEHWFLKEGGESLNMIAQVTSANYARALFEAIWDAGALRGAWEMKEIATKALEGEPS